MTYWVKIRIPATLKHKIEAYNNKYPNDQIDINKISVDALFDKVSQHETNLLFCHGCKTLIDKINFNEYGDYYCKNCTEDGKLNKRKYEMSGNRQIAISKTNGKCAICENDFKLVHHIIPRCNGGTDDVDNLIPLCRECHLKVHNGAFSNCFGINRELLLKTK